MIRGNETFTTKDYAKLPEACGPCARVARHRSSRETPPRDGCTTGSGDGPPPSALRVRCVTDAGDGAMLVRPRSGFIDEFIATLKKKA